LTRRCRCPAGDNDPPKESEKIFEKGIDFIEKGVYNV
jgi:hypothetical protein